jgi:EEF1A lysine methyltransferase 1
MEKKQKGFLEKFREKEQFNQYWYSAVTIAKVVEEIVAVNGAVAFLSTPSIYFTLPEELRQRCYVFDVSRTFVPIVVDKQRR